jgi:protocatechuate 3,4-dioxygenase beta subunit
MCHSDQNTSLLDGGHIAAAPHDDHDAQPDGMTRRAAVGAAGAGGVALLFAGLRASGGATLLDALGPEQAQAAATCVMTPAKTVGPYFVDEKLQRSDVRSNTGDGAVQAGVPLTLRMFVFDAGRDCAPVQGATVDIWHVNAICLYSDVAQNGTSGQNWLRGFQTKDADGLVTFRTIWPGWYTGRAVHIHFKVRVSNGSATTLEFTSQMSLHRRHERQGLHGRCALQGPLTADA